MISDPLIIRYLSGAVVLSFMCWRLYAAAGRGSWTMFNRFMFSLMLLITIGFLFWSIPVLISKDDTVLFLSQLFGDIFLMTGVLMSALAANEIVGFPKRSVRIVIAVFVALYSIFLSAFSVREMTEVPPRFDEEGFYIIDRSAEYLIAYGVAFIPFIPLGIQFILLGRKATALKTRIRAIALGIVVIVVGGLSILQAFFLDDRLRSIAHIVAYSTLFIATAIAVLLTRREQKQKLADQFNKSDDIL